MVTFLPFYCKWKSYTASLFDKDDIDFSYIVGCGETEEEAIDDFNKEFIKQFNKLLSIFYDLEKNYKTVQVDWSGKRI